MRTRSLLIAGVVLLAVAVAAPVAVGLKRSRDREAFACVENAKEGKIEVQYLTGAGGLIGAREINWTPYGANGPQPGLLRVVMKRPEALDQANKIAQAVMNPTRQLVDRNGIEGVVGVVVTASCDGVERSITLPFRRAPDQLTDCGRRNDTADCILTWVKDTVAGAGAGFDSVVAAFTPGCPARNCLDSEPVR